MGSAEVRRADDVAIVGMACRFPGARNVNQYWRLLTDPQAQFSTVPDSRWRAAAFLSDDFRDGSSTYTDTMALLPEVGHFDAAHYGIPPRRAKSMDPQHRMLIDLAREALQDAGWEIEGFDREETSVITSLTESGYRELSTMQIRMRQLAGGEFGARVSDPRWPSAVRAVDGLHGTSVAGLLLNMGPNTVSSVFDLHGESYALDSACSGGLMAVANAVHALRAGRTRIALAGGAQLILAPDLLVGLSRIGAVSRSGRCLPFGAEADGFVLGEGGGVLVLRPLADALAAGDRVYAVIRGVGTANDGTVQGGMNPQAAGQLRALRRAYRDAGLPPDSVGFLEAHGTGTRVGDPVEVGVLRELRGERAEPAYLGAVKAVVGHSLNAAGIAGLIKAALAVHRGVIPPQPPFELADRAGLDAARLTIPTTATPWPGSGDSGEPRRAGVSAFGFGGTGVHMIVEECAPAPAAPPAPYGEPHLLVLSARDRSGLARYARELAHTIDADRPPLAAVADTLARRTPFAERLALVAGDAADAVAQLTAAAGAVAAGRTGELGPGLAAGTVPPGELPEVGVPAPDSLSAGARTAELSRLAVRAVTGPGLRPVTRRTPPLTLPPSPLAPRHHWVVDESAREVTDEAGPVTDAPETAPESAPDVAADVAAEAASAAAPAPAAAQGAAAEARAAGAAVAGAAFAGGALAASVVFEAVSRTGVFPLSDLSGRLALTTDLGFDSLMLQELEVAIAKRAPGFTTEEMFGPGLTIDRLITLVGPHLPEQPQPASYEPLPRQSVADPVAGPQWGAATACVDEFPEVRQFEERLSAIVGSGADFPYFRVHQGNIRDTTVIDDRAYLSFGSYNYLGLSGHPAVSEAARQAVDRYGTSVSASRMLSGERELTVRLERALAEFLGVGDCLALVSGHATNVTAIGHLVGPGDLVVHDALAHDSILQGCALSGAARRPFAHNDTGQLEHMLRVNRSRFRRVLIAVEGAYSMDGDLVDLPAVIELKNRYGALLMVDEAHSIGTVGERGRGVGEFFGVDRSGVDLWMGTLSKAFASCGGYLGGSARMVRWLRHTLPGFVYSVGLTPANAAAALAATELILAEPHRVRTLRRNAELFLGLAASAGLATGSSAHSPIVPCVLGDSARTLRVADRLFDRGVIADPIFHPAVEEGLARLRFFVTSDHAEDDIRRAVSILAEEVAAAGG